MRKFVVTVNGTSYEVEVEEVGAETAAVSAPAPAAKPAAPKAAPAAPKAAPKAAAGDGDPIKAPMPGIFYSAPSPNAKPFVTVGSRVKKGDVVCIIEAMKLMNEITADRDGEIVDVCLTDGAGSWDLYPDVCKYQAASAVMREIMEVYGAEPRQSDTASGTLIKPTMKIIGIA